MQLAYFKLHQRYEFHVENARQAGRLTRSASSRSSQARMLLRDSHDSQVLPRQDGDHETLHRGGGEVVYGHDGPVVQGVFFKVQTPLWMAMTAGLDAW